MTGAQTSINRHEAAGASLLNIRISSALLNPREECSCVCRMYTFKAVLGGTNGSSPFTAVFPDQWAWGCGHRYMMTGMAASLSGLVDGAPRLELFLCLITCSVNHKQLR